jgi:hypothetical protein
MGIVASALVITTENVNGPELPPLMMEPAELKNPMRVTLPNGGAVEVQVAVDGAVPNASVV